MAGMLDVLKDVTNRLEQERIEYFLVGSLASMYYGRPRFTQDIDLVVRLKAKHILGFEKIFPIQEYYCPPREVLQDEVSRRGSFNLIHQGSGIKVDIILDNETEFSTSEFSRKKKIEIIPDIEIYIASAEDIILKKLDYYREGKSEKHINDIREIIMNENIDNTYIEKWVSHLSLEKQWNKI